MRHVFMRPTDVQIRRHFYASDPYDVVQGLLAMLVSLDVIDSDITVIMPSGQIGSFRFIK